MSTPTGQSLRQPLQARHRSRASATSGERQPSVTISPASISCSSLARPRVECCSSPVTRYEGHITPGPGASVERHFATPTQRATPSDRPPSDRPPPERPPPGSTAKRRFSSSRAGRTSIRGFIPPAGSHTSLYAPKSRTTSSPYILGRSSARAWPSPCSPEREPPWETTRSARSEENSRKRATPARDTRSKSIRTWTQPSPKCPYGVPRSPCAASRARNSRRYAPSRAGGTAQSSHPGQAILPSGVRVAVPAASSRIRHSARCSAGSVITTESTASAARTRERAAPSSRISTNSHAPPPGSPEAEPTRSCAMPSTVSGPNPSSPAAASAAALSSAYPRTASAGARGASTRRTTASVTTPSVPSLPQKARATCTPRSGSSASSPPYPEIRREKPPDPDPAMPVRSSARFCDTSSRRPAGAPGQPVPSRYEEPPYAVTASSATLSAVVPQATEWAPHALLPIMPPRVQREWVEGSGPKVSPYGRAASRSRSSTRPGWTTAVRASGSSDTRAFMCRVRSSTTPTPVACPAIDVPPPRGTTGTPASAQIRSAAATSCASRGATTPTGTRR